MEIIFYPEHLRNLTTTKNETIKKQISRKATPQKKGGKKNMQGKETQPTTTKINVPNACRLCLNSAFFRKGHFTHRRFVKKPRSESAKALEKKQWLAG